MRTADSEVSPVGAPRCPKGLRCWRDVCFLRLRTVQGRHYFTLKQSVGSAQDRLGIRDTSHRPTTVPRGDTSGVRRSGIRRGSGGGCQWGRS